MDIPAGTSAALLPHWNRRRKGAKVAFAFRACYFRLYPHREGTGLNGTNEALRNIGWALLRIAIGVLLMTHGYAKFTHAAAAPGFELGDFVETVRALGFPYPAFFAWAAVFAELVGGFLVAIGFFTRPAALAATFTMAVAVYSQRDDPFAQQEKALLFLLIFLVFALGGSGPWSFDDWIRARRAKASSSIFK